MMFVLLKFARLVLKISTRQQCYVKQTDDFEKLLTKVQTILPTKRIPYKARVDTVCLCIEIKSILAR